MKRCGFPQPKKIPEQQSTRLVPQYPWVGGERGVPWGLAMFRAWAHTGEEQAGSLPFQSEQLHKGVQVCVHACAPACLYSCVFICSANIYWEYHCPGPRVTTVNVWLRATRLLPSGASLSSGVNDSRGQCCKGESQEASDQKIPRRSSAKFLCYGTSIGVSTHPPICLSIIFIYLSIYLSFYTIWENNALASDLFFQCVVTGRRLTLVKFLRLSDIVFGNRK